MHGPSWVPGVTCHAWGSGAYYTPQNKSRVSCNFISTIFLSLPCFLFNSHTSSLMSALSIDTPDPFVLKNLWCHLKAWFFSPDHSEKTSSTVDPRLHMLHTHISTRKQRLRRRTLTTYELPDSAVGSNLCVVTQ